MLQLPDVKADSRCVFDSFDENAEDFEFGSNYVDRSHVHVWLDNRLLVQGTDYAWINNDLAIRVTEELTSDSVLEMVRITPPSTPVTPIELIYMIEEKRDELVFNNGRGPTFNANAPSGAPDTALLTNSLPTAIPDISFIYPIIQLLPDGGLAAYPDGVNTGGFRQAALLFQHRVPSKVLPQSMTAGGWFSVVIDDPDEPTSDGEKTYYGFRFLCKGYQTARDGFDLENVAINAAAETGLGVVAGNAQAIVSEARHEEWDKASLVLGTGTSAISFTSVADGYGELQIRIKIQIGTLPLGVFVVGKDIAINALDSQSAAQIAAAVNGNAEASALVTATGGAGTDVAPTDGFINLRPGVNGKLVGNQTVLTPRGVDPGPGYSNSGGGIEKRDGSFTSFGHTVNSNGYHPGLAAFICKGKPEAGEETEEGWYNAYVADDRTIARFIWVPGLCAIEMPGFYLDKGTGELPRQHNSMWMGLGTDEPEATLHIKTAVADDPETPAGDHSRQRQSIRRHRQSRGRADYDEGHRHW